MNYLDTTLPDITNCGIGNEDNCKDNDLSLTAVNWIRCFGEEACEEASILLKDGGQLICDSSAGGKPCSGVSVNCQGSCVVSCFGLDACSEDFQQTCGSTAGRSSCTKRCESSEACGSPRASIGNWEGNMFLMKL